MNSELSELIARLKDGTLSLDQVADRFRSRSWPKTRRPEPQSYLEMVSATIEDPDQLIPGSFEEVTVAYRRGELSRPAYRVLAEAAAEAMERENMDDPRSE